MRIDPKLINRPEQPYAGIRRRAAREHLADVVPQALAEVREHLAAANLALCGLKGNRFSGPTVYIPKDRKRCPEGRVRQ